MTPREEFEAWWIDSDWAHSEVRPVTAAWDAYQAATAAAEAKITRAVEAEREVLRRIHNEADDAHYWNGSGKEARLCQAVANISEWSEEATRARSTDE